MHKADQAEGRDYIKYDAGNDELPLRGLLGGIC